jgi:hypothetical protein
MPPPSRGGGRSSVDSFKRENVKSRNRRRGKCKRKWKKEKRQRETLS